MYDIEQVGYGHSFAFHSEHTLLQQIAFKQARILLSFRQISQHNPSTGWHRGVEFCALVPASAATKSAVALDVFLNLGLGEA